MDNNPYISIVVPAYNESDKIVNTVNTINSYFGQKDYPFEIIVVDDASQDNTFSLVSDLTGNNKNLRVYKMEKNSRKSGAVKTGVLNSRGRLVLTTDADLATSIEQFEKLLDLVVNQNYDIVIGSRGLESSKLLVSQSLIRKSLGKLYGRLANILLISGIIDTQCGFKLYKKSVVNDIFKPLTSKLSVFEIEVLIVATKLGYRIAEIPVVWTHNPDTRLKYSLSSSMKVFLELLRLKYHWKIIFPYKIKK